MRFDQYRRLGPARDASSLDRGFRAEVHDPLWFLARQWQLGEHRGEDASTPVWVDVVTESVPIEPLKGAPDQRPDVVPPEALVETEPDDWWTPGRRIRLGSQVAKDLGLPDVAKADPNLLLERLPQPYTRFDGRGYDGRALYAHHPDHAAFRGVPRPTAEHWDPHQLVYGATFPSGGEELVLDRHAGGHIDWYSVDATGPVRGGRKQQSGRLPGRLRYAGSPHPRWWQIEDERVDMGGMAPDRGHFATLLLIDIVVGHSDDWFTFPLEGRAGTVFSIRKAVVRDSFDDTWNLEPPDDWSMFQVEGLAPTSLLLWPAVASPLQGAILEDVAYGIDEQSNVMWAVEQRAGGRDLPSEAAAEPATSQAATAEQGAATYVLYADAGARSRWHPYVRVDEQGHSRQLEQGRLADLSADTPTLFPAPVSEILEPDAARPPRIDHDAIPWNGMRVQRRWMLVRQTNGRPTLWVQRHRLPLQQPPASLLRYDVVT